jgi:hypothetical protein
MEILKPQPFATLLRPRASTCLWFATLSAILFGAVLTCRALGPDADGEVRVKAALIYRFTTLTEWPESAFSNAEAPVVIEIVGRNPLEAALRAVVEGKKIGSRSVLVITDQEPGPVAHVLVVAEFSKQSLSAKLATVSGRPVLTLSDLPGFISAGGMLRIRRDGPKLGFDVNVHALRQVESVGLKVNPQILKLGRIVEGGDDE